MALRGRARLYARSIDAAPVDEFPLPEIQRYILPTRGSGPSRGALLIPGACMKWAAARPALAVLAVCSPCVAPAAQEITVIRAGRLVDTEKGEVRRDQLILIRVSGSKPFNPVLPGSPRKRG